MKGNRRRLGAMLLPLAVVLLAVGVVLAGSGGVARVIGLVAVAYGLGLGVAAVSFILGHNPLSRR